jgi:phytoene synthase
MPTATTGDETLSAGTVPPSSCSLKEAQRFCARLARRHYENFPVASWLLPASIRPAVQAIYAFARIADDFADEDHHEGERLRRLDEWGRMLEACLEGEAVHPVFIALREAGRRHQLPARPLRDLLAAFRMDCERRRYADFDSLLGYCRLSANPVGRLVLHLHGHTAPQLLEWSDDICTALQLTNHWQDVAIDLARDRIYLPARDRDEYGVTEEELRSGSVTAAFAALMRRQIERTRDRFAAGRPLCSAVGGRLGFELKLTWLGGARILEQIEAVDYDVFRRRPRLDARGVIRVLGRAARWRT